MLSVTSLLVFPQCYYLGATKDAATKILGEVIRPMSVHMPAVKICEKLKKMDSQICELKYGTRKPTCSPQDDWHVTRPGNIGLCCLGLMDEPGIL